MKWLKIAGVVVLISIIIGIVVLVTLPYRMAREIDARIAAIKAQGDPVSGKDLIPHVPDSQNGALIYEKVFKITDPGEKDLDQTSKMISALKGKDDPKVLASVRTIVSKYRSALPLIEQASSYPHCRFKTNWNDPPEAVVFPYYKKMRYVSRLLGQIAAVNASDGKMADSIKAVGLGYGLSESIREEPSLIGFLVRIACISISSNSLKRSAQYGDIPEPQARRLFDMMGKIDLQSHYIHAVKCERAQGLDLMDRVRHHVVVFNKEGEPATNPSSVRSFGIGSWMMDIRACADELFFMKYMDGAVAAASKPYGDRFALKAESEPKFPRYALMSVIVMPVFTKSKEALYESMSMVAGDRVFLAVLAYKSKYGSYPASLDDSAKKLRWKLPLDPMVGKQFRYRRKGKGFILYGLGRNLKDDNAETVADQPENARKEGFLEQYPYLDPESRRSADMIWGKSR